MAAVSRGKMVIVGANETTMAANHDSSKILIIPDAVLIHDVPETDNCEHQISLNDIDKTSGHKYAIVTVNPAKFFNHFIYLFSRSCKVISTPTPSIIPPTPHPRPPGN